MMSSAPQPSELEISRTLPRRDLVILPLLSLLTLMFLFAASELTARHFFYGEERDSCQVADQKAGFRFLPNCTSRTKTDEGPWVVNHYNDCGYRTNESCGPKPPGSTRIALIGSSVAQGWSVPYDETMATRTALELTTQCQRPFEVQNLGRQQCSIVCMYRRMQEALALKPDLLVIAISPYDIETLLPADVLARNEAATTFTGAAESQQKHLLIKRVEKVLTGSRSVMAAEHFLFRDPSTYLKMYLAYGDKADFLRPPFTPLWAQRLQNVDLLLGEMAQKAKSAHVKMVVVEVPNLPQASVLALPKSLPNLDAGALNARLQEICKQHDINFVDVLPEFRRTPEANTKFYLTAGHLDGDGYTLVSRSLVEQLTDGADPAFPGCAKKTENLAAK